MARPLCQYVFAVVAEEQREQRIESGPEEVEEFEEMIQIHLSAIPIIESHSIKCLP